MKRACSTADHPQETRDKIKTKQSARGTRLTIVALPQDWAAECKGIDARLNAADIFDRFRDYWTGVPGAKGLKIDWFGTWRNKCRAERDRLSEKVGTPSQEPNLLNLPENYLRGMQR